MLLGAGFAAALTLLGCEGSSEMPLAPTATVVRPNLTEEEAIGIVGQRTTDITELNIFDANWSGIAHYVCFKFQSPEDYVVFVDTIAQGTERVSAPLVPAEWTATFDPRGRWRVELHCQTPAQTESVVGAWSVDDDSMNVIPVAGLAE
ncbi:MAG: hypothetical protein WEE64_12860 [Dehalococcoidia bacterium]